MSDETKIYLAFRVADQWYGIDVNSIMETLWLVHLEAIPNTNPTVLGLLNFKGLTIPVIDLRKRFGLYEAQLTIYTPIITCQIDDSHVAFLVDEVSDIAHVDSSQLKQTSVSPFVHHTVQLEDFMLRIINIEAVMDGIWVWASE